MGRPVLLYMISQLECSRLQRRPARTPSVLLVDMLHEEEPTFISTPVLSFLARFLPDRTRLTLEACHVEDAAAQIMLYVTATPACVPCPLCDVQTTRVHSR